MPMNGPSSTLRPRFTVPRKQKRRRSWKFKLCAVLLGITVSLLMAEFAVRLLGFNDDYRSPVVSQVIPRKYGPTELLETGFVPYSCIRSTYPSNPRGYFDQYDSIEHYFNSEGWREDEIPVEKPPGTFRILALGDSYLFGQGVRPEDLFINKLEVLLNEMEPSRNVQTINTGQSGYNTWTELQLLKKRGLDFAPDLVMLNFVPNDVEPDIFTDRPKIEFFTDYTSSYTASDWLTKRSDLWMLTKRTMAQQWRANAYLQESMRSYQTNSEKWQRCRESLLEIQTVCQAHDLPLVVVIWPFFINLNGNYPFAAIHEQVISLCQASGIPVIDLKDHFGDASGPELWVHPLDQHPNEHAHQLAANAVAEFLHEQLKTSDTAP